MPKEIDTSIDWEDDCWLAQNKNIPDDEKHAYRIAAIVSELMNGGKIKNPVELDTFTMDRCCSCVNNGHHRIRAMQYMGMESGPFNISGDLDLLEDLVSIAEQFCSPEFNKFFHEDILKINENDIILEPIIKDRCK